MYVLGTVWSFGLKYFFWPTWLPSSCKYCEPLGHLASVRCWTCWFLVLSSLLSQLAQKYIQQRHSAVILIHTSAYPSVWTASFHTSPQRDARAVNHSSRPLSFLSFFFPLALPHLLIKEPAAVACLRGHIQSWVSRNPTPSFLQIHANHNI